MFAKISPRPGGDFANDESKTESGIATRVSSRNDFTVVQVWTAASALRFQSPFPGSEWKKPSKGFTMSLTVGRNPYCSNTESPYTWYFSRT